MMETKIHKLERKNDDLHLQTRTMKGNLLFTRISETIGAVVKNFIQNQLKIEANIELHVAHRLRKRRDGRPHTIVAHRTESVSCVLLKQA